MGAVIAPRATILTTTLHHVQRLLHLPQRLAIRLDSQGQPVHRDMPSPLVQNPIGRVHVQNPQA